ncbi:MAG: hypothetical protein JWO41_295 [Candidatus Saccharibacteria bacterium]|nr:hypothetical protein [Candidatus Saccharibacteria bacterium]
MNNLSLVQRLVVATLALLASCLSIVQVRVHADSAPPQIVINQFKMTSSNGQFFMLYNTTSGPLDMSKFELEYFNNFDIAKSTSSKFIGLSGTLPAHGYYLVSDATTAVCYQAVVDSISLGLSTTSGMIEVLSYTQSSPGGSIMPTLQDYVGWSKTAASGAQTLPTNANAFLQRQPMDVANNPNISGPGNGSWQQVQPDPANPCKITTVPIGSGTPTAVPGGGQLLPASQPSATIINLDLGIATAPSLPAADIGLKSPLITEVLPNPSGTANDGTDEFIELYNDNDVPFDLSGFSLQTGLTSLHTVNFPDGTQLAAKSYTVFYSKILALSLSNTAGQAILIDPTGAAISQTDSYGTAKDGQTWALANGKWYWTTSPTPGAANVIILPVSSRASAKTKAKAATSGAKTTPLKATAKSGTVLASNSAKPLDRVPIHGGVLALVAGLALLYGAYEYRADLRNKFFQLRSYLSARRAHRV